MNADEQAITTKRAQVKAILERRIADELHPGDTLDSERELVAQLGVSRVTVRQAISDLVDEGVLERTQGKGTYVTGPRVNSRLHLASFSREMCARGLVPRSEVISKGTEPADAEVADGLEIELGEPVVRLERLRLADETPMAHEIGWYPLAMFPDLLDHGLTTIYDLLADRYGIVATRGEQEVSAHAADATMARILGIPKRSPLLVTTRITHAGDQVMEYSITSYRADRYKIHSTIRPFEDLGPDRLRDDILEEQ